MRLHRSLYVRAQTPSPSNDDNQVSPEITSSKNVDNLEDEVRRVRNSPAGEPSKLRYGLITGLATAGLVETAYLTWMKLQGGPVSCPLGGTGCDDVLNSKYGTIFGMIFWSQVFFQFSCMEQITQIITQTTFSNLDQIVFLNLLWKCRSAFVTGRNACIWNCDTARQPYGNQPQGSLHWRGGPCEMAVVSKYHSNGRCQYLLHVHFERQVGWCVLYILCRLGYSLNQSSLVHASGKSTHPFMRSSNHSSPWCRFGSLFWQFW